MFVKAWKFFGFSKVTYGYNKENEDIVKKYAVSIYNEMLTAIVEGRTKTLLRDYMPVKTEP